MEIPFLPINPGTRTLFTNVLLFEQAQDFRTPKDFTIFLMMMDHLVDTSDDVALLVHAGIIINFLHDDEDVAILFNQMADFAMIDLHKSYYTDFVKKVVNYINLPWHSYRAMLLHKYFGNPWSIISFVAAVILMLLTITQTGFAIYPVVHPK
ncbi:hypothetical protein LUZ60_013761 [Juncus effusus]|nr:hypothetical protein LUZ60_013761 [Juncus effusus]